MSAIAAIFNLGGEPAATGDVAPLVAAMRPRGPDAVDVVACGPVALGHCLLRTTAEAEGEVQPLASHDGMQVLVMDGYLANYDELRRTLIEHGAPLRGRSDAELVLQAYRLWGADCPARFDGEYAAILWDAQRHELWCVRDHQGLRPLYWTQRGDRLILASDLAAIIAAPGEAPPLNQGYLAEVASDQWFSPTETVYQGIRRIEASHWRSFARDGSRQGRHWTLPLARPQRVTRVDDWVAEYRAMLEQAVRAACRSHAPVGFEVSGGLDSSALFAVAHRLRGEGRLPAPDIKGFTLAGPEGSRANETHYTRLLASHLGTTIEEAALFVPDLDWFVASSRASRDVPVYPNGVMARELEQREKAAGCVVSINGNGGDQWLDGQPYYFHQWMACGDLRRALAGWRAERGRLGRRRAGQNLVHYGLLPLLPHAAQAALRAGRHARRPSFVERLVWLSDAGKAELVRRERLYARSLPRHAPHRVAVDTAFYPYWALAFDMLARQRALAGIDGRSPMLSRRFIEFAALIPEELKLRDGTRRFIHRRAMADLLPPAIANRESKAEFNQAVMPDKADLAARILAGFRHDPLPLFDARGVERLVQSFVENSGDYTLWQAWGTFAAAVLAADSKPQVC